MKTFYTVIVFSFSFINLFSQSDCANPYHVILCPSTTLINQTNTGMGDEPRISCNMTGEDVVYDFTTGAAASRVFISIINATNSLNLILYKDSCESSQCFAHSVSSGNSIVTFNIQGSSNYLLVVESGLPVNYDISFGGDTAITFVNIPDTQGNLGFDNNSCSSPVFQTNKPYFQVKYNGVYKTNPMTLSPLNSVGTMCISSYFKNTTGIEAIKRFEIMFNPVGYASVQSPVIIPGFYLPGDWVITQIGHHFMCNFFALNGSGQGDFSGNPNVCLKYEFCFDIIPVSNNPVLTNVECMAYSDGKGVGFQGNVASGCCPFMNSHCFGSSGSSSSGINGFGFGFTDPGNFLPVALIDFSGRMEDKAVKLHWTTASEINNDFFTVEKSIDDFSWEAFKKVPGSGHSSMFNSYEATDQRPFQMHTFYRLSQTDYDGTTEYLKTIVIKSVNSMVNITPLDEKIVIENSQDVPVTMNIHNSIGKLITREEINTGTTVKNLSSFSPGIYFVSVVVNQETIIKKFFRK